LSFDGPGGNVPAGGGMVGTAVLGTGLIQSSITRHDEVQLPPESGAASFEDGGNPRFSVTLLASLSPLNDERTRGVSLSKVLPLRSLK
jgi:hypothetical protein